MNKILSIIIPSYNMEKYLPKCLGSLVIGSSSSEFEFESGTGNGQSRTPTDNSNSSLLDVIIVNDGSKDRTSEIAHDYASRFPDAVRVIDKPNGHYGSCINAGLKVAEGKYVKVLDADDSFDTEGLSRYLAFLSECDADMVFNDYVAVRPDQSALYKTQYPFAPRKTLPISELKVLDGEYYMHGLAYRKAIFDDIHYRQLEGVLYTDGEWCAIPPLVSRSIAYCPETVYRYLVGREGQSVGSAVRDKNFQVLVDVLIDLDDKRRQLPMPVDPVNGEVYLLWVKSYLKMVYSICVNEVSLGHFKLAFGRLDDLVKERFPSVYSTQDMSIHFGNRNFHYLDFMRKHRRLSRMTMAFVRLVKRLRSRKGHG